jgi:hypothetical protein
MWPAGFDISILILLLGLQSLDEVSCGGSFEGEPIADFSRENQV